MEADNLLEELENQAMKKYVCHIEVYAKPVSRLGYNIYRGWELPDDEDGADEGFLVEYIDGGVPNHPNHKGYISWSPSDVFIKGYSPISHSK